MPPSYLLGGIFFISTIVLINIVKKYKKGKNNFFYALNNINLSFPSSGLVSIVGKSGSGKSTLLNTISLIDNPSSGEYLFNGKRIQKWSDKRKTKFRNEKIGIIFQHYFLLEHETVLFNIMLPSLIKGDKWKKAKSKAEKLLNDISFPENLYLQKCENLSGGEKERVAILRSLINDPDIILADEPTGALDNKNSLHVMKLLKEISKTKLVIVVSHNLSLVKEFSSRIITISDGKITKDETYDSSNATNNLQKPKEIFIKENKWSEKLVLHNFKRRFKRNILSLLGLTFGLVCSLLIIGFGYGAPISVHQAGEKQFDFGVSTLYKETTKKIEGSNVSIVQMSKPSNSEVNHLNKLLDNYIIEPNIDALIPPGMEIKLGEEQFNELYYFPIYSFLPDYHDHSLLIEGKIPQLDVTNEVIINKAAQKVLEKKLGHSCLNITLNIHTSFQSHYYTGNETESVITDYFVLDKIIKIVGIVDEMDFLSMPKIYYSYVSMMEYLSNIPMNNLSVYLDKEITWLERVVESGANEDVSSYSLRMFNKKHNDKSKLIEFVKQIPKPYKIDNNAIVVQETLEQLIQASTLGMDIFLVIAIIGTILIMGIVSFYSYCENKKESAILSCLGASNGQICDVYVGENLLLGLIGLLLSFILSPLLSLIINKIILSTMGYNNMINIPFKEFMGYRFMLPILIISATLLVCILSTILPIGFSKKISIKEELKDE